VARAWQVPGLHRTAAFRDAAGRVILTRWRETMSYRAGTLLGEDIEELHAMRVSSRRLRAAMDAFSEAFPPRSFRRHLGTVKEITDTLGDARDLDVAIDALTALLPEFTAEMRVGIESLVAEYRERRADEARHIAALFDRLDATGYSKRFERWVGRHTGVDPKALRTRPPDEGKG
jgi:CHAD domain-containing protein